jgi:hypothetical protein
LTQDQRGNDEAGGESAATREAAAEANAAPDVVPMEVD